MLSGVAEAYVLPPKNEGMYFLLTAEIIEEEFPIDLLIGTPIAIELFVGLNYVEYVGALENALLSIEEEIIFKIIL